MTTVATSFEAFSYGEHRDTLQGRSLGYRLLAPAEPRPWSHEVEALARRLQAAPYPDRWPPVELFCSVLLADGNRVVALARYGLADHTPSPRRGGLELIGLIGPADLDVPTALAAYRWLKQRRATTEDLARLNGCVPSEELRSVQPEALSPPPSLPVLPVRLWQGGALLFAATSPADPDHRLGLLTEGAGNRWQWLPFIGPDFPLQEYAQRGPLIAWTPHLEGVALKLDARTQNEPPAAPRRRGLPVALVLVLLFLGLLAANLWALVTLPDKLARHTEPAASSSPSTTGQGAPPASTSPTPDARERFARALYQLIVQRGGSEEWIGHEQELLARYDRLVRANPDLAVQDREGRLAVAALSVLAGRTVDRVEEAVRQALRGLDPQWIRAAVELVRRQLQREEQE